MHSPLIFGEVLYDCFPDGSTVLGGAPFNVAWHLQGFGLEPAMLSRVGGDALGASVRRRMQAWGMRTDLLQEDAQHPTGQVNVTLDGKGSPHFEIAAEQAYDYLEAGPALAALGPAKPALLYHGSLALRHPVSRKALNDLKKQFDAPIFLDINLRAPWWTRELIDDCLRQAAWAKLNDDELRILVPAFGDSEHWDAHLTRLCEQYGLSTLIVTLGGAGALLKQPGQPVFHVTPPAVEIVDTVGAGDSFSAVSILGLLEHWPPELILQRAVAFAAEICRIRGATTDTQALYNHYRRQWED